jgi:hypothetical protein
MGHFSRRVEVLAVERVVAAPQSGDDLLVSVGHRPRSISRWSAAFHAKRRFSSKAALFSLIAA